MEKTTVKSDQSFTERCCERINELTEHKYELVASTNHIVMIGFEGPVGHWKTWKEAKAALVSIVRIVEQSFLNLVLLGDSSSIHKKHLSKLEQELADAKEELVIVKIHLDFMRRAVRRSIQAP